MAMTSETSSGMAYEETPTGLLLRLYPRWSGAMTRKPAADSGSICLCHEYQNSGKPWSRTTTGPSSGPAATACKPTSPFLMGTYSTERPPSVQCSFDGDIAHAKREGCRPERQFYLRESEARGAGSGGAHLRGVDSETQTREVGLAEGHRARVEVTPDEEQQERDGGVVFVEDGVDNGRREVQA